MDRYSFIYQPGRTDAMFPEFNKRGKIIAKEDINGNFVCYDEAVLLIQMNNKLKNVLSEVVNQYKTSALMEEMIEELLR